MIRKYCKQALSLAATMMSFALLADAQAAKAARRFATGGDVTRFRYTDPSSGVGYTAFVHTFTNTAAAAEFQNMSGKTLPVRLLVVGGGGAGMDGHKGTPSRFVYGGGGGGGGGAGGSRPSSVNGVRPTIGAAGGGGSGDSDATERAGASGTYTSSTLFPGEIGIANPSGGNGGTKTYGGGGGGAGANGYRSTGGRGLTSDITGEEVVYGSGGGGGGFCRGDSVNAGGNGGTNAGVGGTGDATSITKATNPVANTGSGGAGGISFGGEVYSDFDAIYAYGTPGADGVVIIRYEVEIPRPNGFKIIFR